MRVRQVCFLLLIVTLGWRTGVVTPDTVEAQDLLPLRSIGRIRNLVLQERGDKANVYFPARPRNAGPFPVVAVLQGAFIDKAQYRAFGRQLARHGFVVVIPNHFIAGALFPDQFVVLDVLDQMERENARSSSPLFGIVDTTRLGLTGHSAGGAAGLFVIDESCNPPFCSGFFQRPAALRAGAFYGTNSFDPFTGQLIDVHTDVPVALVQGSLDSINTPDEAQATFNILDGPRALLTIDGANHYGINNRNNPPGPDPDPSDPTIRQRRAVRRVARAIGRFLRTHVPDSDDDDDDD